MASQRKKQKKAAKKQTEEILKLFDEAPFPPSSPNPPMLRCMNCRRVNRINAWEWYCFECKEYIARSREELRKVLEESRRLVPPPK